MWEEVLRVATHLFGDALLGQEGHSGQGANICVKYNLGFFFLTTLLLATTRRDFLTYERSKFSFKHVIEHAIRITQRYHNFFRKFVTLVSSV